MDTKILKVGDRVLIQRGYGWNGVYYIPASVIKNTRTGVVTVLADADPMRGSRAHELIYNPGGNQRGVRYSQGGSFIKPFDQQTLDIQSHDMTMEKHYSRLDSIKWKEKSDSLVLAVIGILDAPAKGESEES